MSKKLTNEFRDLARDGQGSAGLRDVTRPRAVARKETRGL